MGQSKVMPSPIPKHIQVANKSSRAWFYPSKGLNELFSWAETVPNTSGIKSAAASYRNPNTHTSSINPKH
jgi:hypothetical protein